MLTLADAHKELKIAALLNPGPWEQHSLSVGRNAGLIAAAAGLDAEAARVMGTLHDIGRRNGITGILHVLDGWQYMSALNQPEIARICLTHSFPDKNVSTYAGAIDCSEDQLAFLRNFISEAEYDEYDLLIQLCDAISLPNGACIMEKRLVDVALRHGVHPMTVEKWRAFMKAKEHFDRKCGCSIYSLLPNVFENSL